MFKGISGKLIPIMSTLVNELAALSWIALVMMLAVGGILIMMGNEFGGKKVCKNGIYGFIIIQIASMLI
ncbi:hypothetical protein AAK964_08595 [Tissierella praeacuta]|uniref:hypothetical protein n=1 Tax=Tissierella praeacuta TaxID=43131 RepID=UPI0035143000